MKHVDWNLADDAQTEQFRAQAAKRKDGSFKIDNMVYTVAKLSTITDQGGVIHEIEPGERVKVLMMEDLEKHAEADWVYFAEEVHVRYGEGVESLRTGVPLAVLPVDLET